MSKRSTIPIKQEPQENRTRKKKTKHKEMFNELETIEQKRINKMSQRERTGYPSIKQQYIPQEDSEQEKSAQAKQNNLEEVCQIVNKLFTKNKINVKNAFEIPLVDLEQLPDFNNTDYNDHAWKKLSATLQNDSKIFDLRVESTYNSTYKILSIMARHHQKDQEVSNKKPDQQNQEDEQNDPFALSREAMKNNPTDLAADPKHIQKNKKHLNLESIECGYNFDPLFQRTKRLFDQSGLKGLLINGIPINPQLELPLNSGKFQIIYKRKKEQIMEDQNNTYHGPNIPQKNAAQHIKMFKRFDSITSGIKPLITSQKLEFDNIDQLWNQLQQKNLSYQPYSANLPINDYYSMVDESDQQKISSSKRQISDFITLKKPLKLLTEQAIREDEKNWMTDEDRKLLGLPLMGNNQNKRNNTNFLYQRQRQRLQEYYVDFTQQLTENQTKQKILHKQIQKQDHFEEVEDKFLLPKKNKFIFDIQQPLTLRHEVFQLPQNNYMDEEYSAEVLDQHYHPEQQELYNKPQQIDIRYQQMSIKDMKQKLGMQIKNKEANFHSIYQSTNSQISPALCFLTILHLANETNTLFQQREQDNFFLV